MNDRRTLLQMPDDHAPDCRIFRDILPAYALGGIDLADRSLIDNHVRVCAECRQQLDRLIHVADVLPLGLQVDATLKLDQWGNIATRIGAEDSMLRVTAPTDSVEHQPGEIRDTPRKQSKAPARLARHVPTVFIASLVVALITMGGWANSLRNDLKQSRLLTSESISAEMLNDSSVRTYAVERTCSNCHGTGQLGLSETSRLGVMVAQGFDPSEDHLVWGLTDSGELRKVCQLYIDPTGSVMQTFVLPDRTATLQEIYIMDKSGNLIYVAHLRPVTPSPTVAPSMN